MIEESQLKEVNRKLRQVAAKAATLPDGFAQYDNKVYLEVEIHDRTVIACTTDEVLDIASKIESNHNWEDAHAMGWWPYHRPIDAHALLEAKGTK